MYSMKAIVKVIQRDFKNFKVKKRPQKKQRQQCSQDPRNEKIVWVQEDRG